MSENFISNLPKRFARNTLDLCGEAGRQWLNNLPRIIGELEKNWSLKAEKSFRNLSYNYVAPCLCADGGEAVLKIALPLDNPEIFNEARFLQMANGKGALSLGAILENREKFAAKKVCVVVSGGNVDTEVYRQILQND